MKARQGHTHPLMLEMRFEKGLDRRVVLLPPDDGQFNHRRPLAIVAGSPPFVVATSSHLIQGSEENAPAAGVFR